MKTTIHKSSVMKRIIPAIAIAATTLVACNTNPGVDSASQQKAVPTADTTGYAQFQAWKAQNELANTANYNANAPQQQSHTHTRTIVREHPSSGSGSTASTSSGTATRKKGWSSAAKGAVIGGVAGAAGGAVVNKKNRAAGAVIGGVVGAAGGYGIGRSIDKKNGRN